MTDALRKSLREDAQQLRASGGASLRKIAERIDEMLERDATMRKRAIALAAAAVIHCGCRKMPLSDCVDESCRTGQRVLREEGVGIPGDL